MIHDEISSLGMRVHSYGPGMLITCKFSKRHAARLYALSGANMASFTVTKEDGQARSGVLRSKGRELKTPALLIYTKRGSPMYLTPDVLYHLPKAAQAYLVDPTKFLGNPTPETLSKVEGKGRGFCALEDRFIVASPRDTVQYNYPQWLNSGKQAVRVEGFSGSQALKPNKYAEVSQLFEPDLWVSLSDEIPAEASEARAKASVNRTLRWLDDTIEGSSKDNCARLLAPIQGGVHPTERSRSSSETAKREDVFGYAVCGLGTGETNAQFQECLSASLANLPRKKPRLVQAALTPLDMLEAISQGADLLDSTYATQVTSSGYALDLEGQTEPSDGRQGLKINMMDGRFQKDRGPPVHGCQCFTCLHHTRAYVHHLLNVHEMTAQILLEIHNLHQILEWFAKLRVSIENGSFQSVRDLCASRVRTQHNSIAVENA